MINFNSSPVDLFPHQKEGVEHIIKHKKFGIFYECGTGKTFLALEAIRQLKVKTLIIVPPIVYDEWVDNIEFYLDDSYDVTLITPLKLIRRKEMLNDGYQFIVFDEAHGIISESSKISKFVSKLSEKSEYSVGLTGTPIAKNLIDVYNIYQHLGIRIKGIESRKTFLSKFCNVDYQKNWRTGRYFPIIEVKPEKREELRAILHTECLIKKQEECVKLPPSKVHLVRVPKMTSRYDNQLKKGIIEYPNGMKDTLLSLVKFQKRHQCANGFVYGDDGEIIYENKDNNKLKMVRDLTENTLTNTNKVVIVYQYKQDLKNLKETLKDFTYTSDDKEFKETDVQILFRQSQSAEGINLQHVCNTMIFYSYSWSFIKHDQMKARINRQGQTKSCIYHIMISENTIEETVWQAIQQKWDEDTFLKNIG